MVELQNYILTTSGQNIPPQHLIAASNASEAAVPVFPNWIPIPGAAVCSSERAAETARFQPCPAHGKDWTLEPR
jgi:hypothetical protein